MAEATPQVPVNAGRHNGRLKYADPSTLPSYPSTGLPPDGAAASAAATLGWNNQKPIELWKPDDKLSSASAAAVLAKDYKMAPQWQPSSNSHGHQAALLAVGSASSALKHSRSESKDQHEGWGNSAATQAFHAQRPSSVQPDDLTHGNTAATQAFISNRSQSLRQSKVSSPPPQDGHRSLLAAQGAMASSRTGASSASPSARPDSALQAHAASSALNGAAIAHRASMQPKTSLDDTGAVPVTTMTRNMFTSHPMVKPEVDEQANNERLHQSAVEMAKKMYNQQQKSMDQARASGEDPDAYVPPVLNLQDAAYKQAQERLSKLHDEHQESRDMQEYYGHAQTPKRRSTVLSKMRRKNSDDELWDDHEESAKIRQQMSMFSKNLSEVDKNKRQHDRDALLAAAQRNVKASLHGMDEKVYNDTGKVNPTLLTDWEAKAHLAAQNRHESRSENKGQVNIGGGVFMTQEQINAIAAKRMQPVLDDIGEKAEKERERVAAQKADEEMNKAEAQREKERERETKALNKRVKEEDKQDLKARKQAEKAEKEEQKRIEKEEKRKSKRGSGFIFGRKGARDEPVEQEAGVAAAREEQTEREETHELRESVETTESAEAGAAIASGTVAAEPISSIAPQGREEREVEVEEHVPSPVVEREVEREERETEPQIEREVEPEPVRGPSVDYALDNDSINEPENEDERGEAEQRQGSEGSTKQGSKVRGWIKNRLSRTKSVNDRGDKKSKAGKISKLDRSEAPEATEPVEAGENNHSKQENPETLAKLEKGEKRRSFFRGGTILRRKSQRQSSQTTQDNRSSSLRDVAMAGKSGEDENRAEPDTAGPSEHRDSRGVSPVSSVDGDADETRSRKDANSGGAMDMLPPRPIEDSQPRASLSPSRDSRFREEMDQ